MADVEDEYHSMDEGGVDEEADAAVGDVQAADGDGQGVQGGNPLADQSRRTSANPSCRRKQGLLRARCMTLGARAAAAAAAAEQTC